MWEMNRQNCCTILCKIEYGTGFRGCEMVEQATLENIIDRIVDVAAPERIILFGSAVRGDLRQDSDVDLLIVKDGEDALTLMSRIYREMRGIGVAVDALVVSPEDLERYKNSHALIIKPALQEGVVVYESA